MEGAGGARGRAASRMRLARFVLGIATVLGLALASGAWASPYIHAHRGGSLATIGGERRPVYPENSLPAFRNAAKRGFVLELDVKLSADRRAVVIHDDTLDRTTDCEGPIKSKTLAQLRRDCDLDLLGTEGTDRQLGPRDPRRAEIPTVGQALRLAKRKGVEVNLEIKNLPTDNDFDPGPSPAYARTIAAQIKASGFPPSRLIVQSFVPSNLDVIEDDPYFERTDTSFLTLGAINDAGPGIADARGYEFVSPQWPVSSDYIQRVHALGLRIVPFTLDTRDDIVTATKRGVDALITNDPMLARRAIRSVEPQAAPMPKRPTQAQCAPTMASRLATPIESFHPDDSGPRVFAIQFKQDLKNVRTYARFRRKIECLIREYVRPRMAKDRPNVIALTEDVGLMTLATGSRGKETRQTFENGGQAPGCENAPSPCGVAFALTSISAGYAKEVTAYQARFGGVPPFRAPFLAGTDTFARGWMQTFSDMAKRYDLYILGSNNQAEFRESVDPSEITTFRDPDLPRPQSVYVATSPQVYNEAFMWGPEDVTKEGPRPLRNVVTRNKKVPLTEIENLISLNPGPKSGPDAIENVEPYRIPGTKARMSFATSLPAFVYNGGPVTPFGQAPPAGVDPCADTSKYYMYCLEKLGTNLVMQDEANPGRWATPPDSVWQPLEWMSSTWRASTDPTVSFDYNVTPHMVGNLADLPFDGQTAITQRGLKGPRGMRASCNYIGDSRFMPDPPENDPSEYQVYAGPKRQFLGLADWVVPDGPRDELRRVGSALQPGSGKPRENDYLETAVVADLTYPPDPARPNCNTGSVTVPGRCANLHAGSSLPEELTGTGRGDRILGLAGRDRIQAGAGADCVRGQSGGDALRAGKGADLLDGGPGDDILRARNGGTDRLRCGTGDDVAFAGPRDHVTGSCEDVRIG